MGGNRSNGTDFSDKVIQLLLGVRVFLGHLLVLCLPLRVGLFESLDFAFVVAGLDVSLAESVITPLVLTHSPRQ